MTNDVFLVTILVLTQQKTLISTLILNGRDTCAHSGNMDEILHEISNAIRY